MTRYFLTVIIAVICISLHAQTRIKNVKFEQTGYNIVVTYDLYCNGGFNNTQLFYTTNNEVSWHGPLKSIAGDVNNVQQGKGKSITWNVLNDQDWLISDNIKFKVVAEVAKSGTFTDTRDEKSYKWIKIGSQIWMAENLNYNAGSSCWCYNDISSNCAKYGRLYTYETAKNACPSGWHLPSKAEFETLLNNYGYANEAYIALREGGNSGFNALFGGGRHEDGYYDTMGSFGYFWSSTEYNSDNAWRMYIYSSYEKAYLDHYTRSVGRSVRCVQN